MSSSSVSEICPRSILRYRPLETNTVPTVSPWIPPTTLRGSQTTKQTHAQGAWSSLFSAHASGSLATVVGLGMCLMLLLILAGQSFAGWAQIALDDWRYGRPRTFQTDTFVGQETTGQPSHFVALNNRGQVEIIELPGNDPTHTRIFLGPRLAGAHADLVPVTLRFVDSHHTHHPDLVVQFGDTSTLFLNTGQSFQLQQ